MELRVLGHRIGIRAWDVLLPLILLVLGLWNLWFDWDSYMPGSPPNLPIDTVTTVVATLVLVARRHAPVFVMWVVGGVLVLPDLVVPTGPVFWGEWAPLIVAAFSIGLARSWRTGLPVIGLALASLAVLSWRYPADFLNLAGGFTWIGPVALALWAGHIIGRQREQSRALAAQTVELERTRSEHAALAVARERARIARELHDVVAHAVSIMVVQASAAENILEADPEAARTALRNVQGHGREALEEMKLLLGLMREGRGDGGRTPVPTLRRLDALVEGAEASGLTVHLETRGLDLPIPASIDVSAYRVIQEALTNALKYAPGADVWVVVDVGDGSVRIEVRDDGDLTHEPGAAAGGFGLLGLRERIGLLGGELAAGPREEGGGFAVRATLPLALPVAP